MLLLVAVGALALVSGRLRGAVLAVGGLVRESRLRSCVHHHAQRDTLWFVDGALTGLGAVPRVVLALADHGVVLRFVI